MARDKRDGLLIAGGGLAGSLAALAMARARPEVPILLVEEGESFGGDELHGFFAGDIEGGDLWLAEPLAGHAWPGYYVAFPGLRRKLRTDCGAIESEAIDRAVRETLRPDQYRLGTKIVAVRDNELILQGGEKIRADGAVDARGAANLSMLELGWRRFFARDYRLAGAHGLDRPVLVDATAGAADGARFFRCLPLAEDRMMVEDVALSELPGMENGEAAARLDAYLARRGWTPAERLRETAGAHALTIGGDFPAFWRVGGARVAKLGPRGGFFHPATGQALPDALRTATMLTEQGDFTGARLHDVFESQAAALWRKREFYRGFNKSLFQAPPGERMAMLERLHGLDPGVIARFHGGHATMFDRRRISRPA